MSNQASEDELKQYLHEMHHRIMGDYDGDPDEEHPYQDETKPYFWEDEAKRLQQLIRTEKLKLLAEVRERVVGEDEKLVIPDYPSTDDEGEPLYSKRAAKEGRKQVTARYHTRKELRNDQRTELTKLEAEL